MTPYHIHIAVWGEPYIQMMDEIMLVWLLNESELPTFARTHDCTLIFVTSPNDIERIRQKSGVKRAAAICAVDIIAVEIDTSANVYQTLSRAHYTAAVRSAAEKACVITLTPDAICSSGTLSKLAAAAGRGKRAVMAAGPRLLEETALPALRSREKGAVFTSRELVAFTLEHLHPEMKRYFYTNEDFSTFPSVCCWDQGDAGFLMRCFHLHPLMIAYGSIKILDALETSTVDGEFVGTAIGRWDDIEVVTDSDDLLLVTLTPRDAFYSMPSHRQGSIEELHKAAYNVIVNPLHRMFFGKAIKIHTCDLDETWETLEEDTGHLAFEVLRAPAPLLAPMVQSQRRGLLGLLTRS